VLKTITKEIDMTNFQYGIMEKIAMNVPKLSDRVMSDINNVDWNNIPSAVPNVPNIAPPKKNTVNKKIPIVPEAPNTPMNLKMPQAPQYTAPTFNIKPPGLQ
jgi:hypothetical protein